MKLTDFKFDKRKKTSEYEYETVEVSGQTEGDDILACLVSVKEKIYKFFDIKCGTGFDPVMKVEGGFVDVPKTKIVAKEVKIKKEPVAPEATATPTTTEVKAEETPAKVEEPTKEVAEDTKKKTVKKDSKAAAAKYDRELDSHKRKFSAYLTEKFPNWKDNLVLKEKAAKASRELIGKDFLDNTTGFLTDTFKEAVDNYLK